MLPSKRSIFESRVLPRALGQEINVDLVNQARDIQKRIDISDSDFMKIFRTDPASQAQQRLKIGAPRPVFQGQGDYSELPLSEVPKQFQSRFKGGMLDRKVREEPVRLALTGYGEKLFERAGEIAKIRAETAAMRGDRYGAVRARRTGSVRR